LSISANKTYFQNFSFYFIKSVKSTPQHKISRFYVKKTFQILYNKGK
jgi:hypothetical protein